MPKHYKRIPNPGKTPTSEQLDAYLARIASLGQIDHYRFSGGGVPGVLVAGILFILAAIGISLAMVL